MAEHSQFRHGARAGSSQFVPTMGGTPIKSETRFRNNVWRPPENKDIAHSETVPVRVGEAPKAVDCETISARLGTGDLPSLPFRATVYPGEVKVLENVCHDATPYDSLEVETHEDLRVLDVLVDGESQMGEELDLDAGEFRPGAPPAHRFHLAGLGEGKTVGLKVKSTGHERREIRARLYAMPTQ